MSRSHFPRSERALRSRLAKLTHDEPLHGSSTPKPNLLILSIHPNTSHSHLSRPLLRNRCARAPFRS